MKILQTYMIVSGEGLAGPTPLRQYAVSHRSFAPERSIAQTLLSQP